MILFITYPDRRYFILDGQYDMAHMSSIKLIDQMWENYSDMYRTLYIQRFDDVFDERSWIKNVRDMTCMSTVVQGILQYCYSLLEHSQIICHFKTT